MKNLKWWYSDWPLEDNLGRLFAIIAAPGIVLLVIVGLAVTWGNGE